MENFQIDLQAVQKKITICHEKDEKLTELIFINEIQKKTLEEEMTKLLEMQSTNRSLENSVK